MTNNQETCVLLASIWEKAKESNRAAITKLTTKLTTPNKPKGYNEEVQPVKLRMAAETQRKLA